MDILITFSFVFFSNFLKMAQKKNEITYLNPFTTRLCDDGSSTSWPLVPAGFCCPDSAGLRGPVSSRPSSPGAARWPASHLGPGQHLPCHPAAVGSHGSRSVPPHSLPPSPACGHPARRHVPDSHPRHDCDSSRREPFEHWSQRFSSFPFSIFESTAWGERKEDWKGDVQGGELMNTEKIFTNSLHSPIQNKD